MTVPPPEPARPADARRIEEVLDLARRCRYEADHAHQVAHLALALFDELAPLHGLGPDERFWLHAAALLHDIGWVHGQRSHHRSALRRILEAPELPFDNRERLLVGSVARYHRKALPSPAHEHFIALSPEDRDRVRKLAALLRVADALDRSHAAVIERLSCEVGPDRVIVHARVRGRSEAEAKGLARKGDLFAEVFGRRLVLAPATQD